MEVGGSERSMEWYELIEKLDVRVDEEREWKGDCRLLFARNWEMIWDGTDTMDRRLCLFKWKENEI